MGAVMPVAPAAAVGEHGLFGLRDASPRAQTVAAALAEAWKVQHDLHDLGMSEDDWARLFAQR